MKHIKKLLFTCTLVISNYLLAAQAKLPLSAASTSAPQHVARVVLDLGKKNPEENLFIIHFIQKILNYYYPTERTDTLVIDTLKPDDAQETLALAWLKKAVNTAQAQNMVAANTRSEWDVYSNNSIKLYTSAQTVHIKK